ncbi:MAG: DUF2269 domain-containing protein [Micromonosporaceae bacterium]|nr:DUF2269 domain-containing protein [Micromonosporaceae bacterium]
MPPPWRKLALLAHIVASVGWLGAVLASLVLAIVGLAATDGHLVRAAYLVMPSLGWAALVPLSVLSLVTGLIQALVTQWGLARHYWVIIKLVMNLFATTILLLYMRTLTALEATARAWGGGDPASLRDMSPALHSVGALVLLLVAAVLSVYKPKGQTRYGQRRAVA